RPDLFHNAAEFMAEGRADPGVGNQPPIGVNVGAADAGPGHPEHGVLGMLDSGHGLARRADSKRASVVCRQHALAPLRSWRQNHGFGWLVPGRARMPRAEKAKSSASRRPPSFSVGSGGGT